MLGELDHGVGQQLQCPAGAARRRVRAGGCHEQGFLLARELALRPRPRVLAQRPFQIAFHEAPLGPVHGGAAYRHGAGNLLVAAAGVRRQQYLGALELAGGTLAFTQHRGELAAFGLAQFDMIKYIHLGLLVGAQDESTYESKIRRCASFQWARLHRKARPVSGLHLRLLAHVPTTARRGRHATPLPRQPTFGSPDGPHHRASWLYPTPTRRRPKHRATCCPGKSAHPKMTENQPVKTFVQRY